MIEDSILFIVGIFIAAIVIIVGYLAFTNINTSLQANTNMNQTAKDVFQAQTDAFGTTWDYTFLTIYVALLIGILVMSWFVASSPLLFFVFFIVVAIMSSVSGYLANAFSSFILDPNIAGTAANFPIMVFILEHYLVMTIISLFLMLIVFFAKPSGGMG